MQNSDHGFGVIALLAVLLLVGLLAMWSLRKARRNRVKSLGRDEWSLDQLVDSFSMPSDDKSRFKSELSLLAKKLDIAVGQLRADDVIEDLVGRDFVVGDRLLETEIRLQRVLGSEVSRRLTVKEVVTVLARG